MTYAVRTPNLFLVRHELRQYGTYGTCIEGDYN
jgi:hypothetical protein